MDDPVYDIDFENNHRCERTVLETWVNQYGTNPFTRSPLSADNLINDVELKNQIDSYVEAALNPSPSI
jgi:hypothetical protein